MNNCAWKFGIRRAALAVLACTVFVTGCVVEVEAEPVVAAAVDPETEAPKPDHIWPPRVGERYPNLQLLDSFGDRIALESLAGKIVLVEPIGMDCPACNAFAGGNRPGGSGFLVAKPQSGLPSIHEMLKQYAGGGSLIRTSALRSSICCSTGPGETARLA